MITAIPVVVPLLPPHRACSTLIDAGKTPTMQFCNHIHHWGSAMRYFEDFKPGDVMTHDGISLTEEEILEFAGKYDPQPFHTDPAAAAETIYGGLIASGWQTASTTMRMMYESYIKDSSSMGSPGLDSIRWHKPVRPGDTLSLRSTVNETRRSRSKPDRGIVFSTTETLNQNGEVVMSFSGMGMYGCRDAKPEK
jgi:acyl dehydratase